jgi:hypothetical protein
MSRIKLKIGNVGLCWVVALTLCSRSIAQNVDLPTATVHIQAFDPFGTAILVSQLEAVHLFTPDRKRDLAKPDKSLTLAGVPYGNYRLIVWDNGGGFGERDLVVNTREVWGRIGLAFPAGDTLGPPGNLEIRGDVNPKPPAKKWWVRIEGVSLNVSKEAPISSSGKFLIAGLTMGAYLVEIFEGSKLRHVEELEIDPKEPSTHLNISILPNSGER